MEGTHEVGSSHASSSFSQVSKQICIVGAILSRDCRDVPHPCRPITRGGYVPLTDKRLEVAAELHAIRRVHVNHLDLSAQALVVQKRVHHHQGITENHPV